jgi:hypothetical protein
MPRKPNKSCNVATIRYPKHKFKNGDTVTIVHSTYSGISVGKQGVVECLVKQGYGVAFTKTWPATFINEKPPSGKRVMFFEHSEVK